jgi:hypothetical protein
MLLKLFCLNYCITHSHCIYLTKPKTTIMNFSHLALSAGVASLVTLIIGFIWYHPKVFGTAWMKAEGLTEEELQKGNMGLTFGLSLVLSFIAAFMIISTVVIHQFGALGMVGGDPTLAKPSYAAFLADYGTAFRTFKHGALHGTLLGLGFVFPILAINGMFNRKSWKSIFIGAGYWIVTLAIMGGIICGWADDGFHFS